MGPAAVQPVPVLLVTGFLGAGKTTVVNAMLAHAGGRRIAAVVNDFGAINIDAELVTGAEGGVVSLANGCICCTLEGDLLRTLAGLLRRSPRPDCIVIETSGVADPARHHPQPDGPGGVAGGTAGNRALRLGRGRPGTLLDDALLRKQLQAADVVALSKADLAGPEGVRQVRAAVAAMKPSAVVVEAMHGALPAALLFPAVPDWPADAVDADRRAHAPDLPTWPGRRARQQNGSRR